MKTSWNDKEDELLQYLPLRAQIIYLRGIRRFMDYETGISGGAKRRISLRSLAEVSQEESNRQLKDLPTKNAVRASIEQLKKSGLIERIEDKDFLIFFLPKADTNKSVKNNHNTTTTQPQHRNNNTSIDSNINELRHNHNTTTTQPQHRNNNTHQESGYQDDLSSINTTMSSSSEKYNEVSEIFNYWKETLNHPRSKLDEKRKKAIKQSIKIGYSIDEIKSAILGCSLTPHNMGENKNGQVYDDICLILRDAGQIDRFIGNSTNPPGRVIQLGSKQTKSHLSDKTNRSVQATVEWLNEG